jgi:D-beta-D-heptose 7-phosphate kinase/D-beta-D-heptose 1-phosphate adenosyltransferase
MNKVVLATGGFDPLHSGHIKYLKEAAKYGDKLVVGLNSDEWLVRKKNKPFMTWLERASILLELECVDEVIGFNDSDGSAIDAINFLLQENNYVIFANGGDRSDSNIPELSYYEVNNNVEFVFGIGGTNKQNSSSKILSEWKNPKTKRSWGYYRVLHTDGPELKVKELVVNPKSSLSLQLHRHRSEHWIITNSTATVKFGKRVDLLETRVLNKYDEIHIPKEYLHQLVNTTESELRIVEIQYGDICIEEDIERF